MSWKECSRFVLFTYVSGLDQPVRPKSVTHVLGTNCHPSLRAGPIDYPFHDKVIVVTNCGRICLGHKKINFSTVFAGQAVGIKEVHDDIWLVSFMDYDLGYFDLETRVLEPLENPFGPKVLAVRCVTYVPGPDPGTNGAPGGIRTPDP
jgi:hypothetical protein